MSLPDSDPVEDYAQDILRSRKYHLTGLCETTVKDLVSQELPRHRSVKDALDAVRRKLHNIVAPYLGDPDYPAAESTLEKAFASKDQAAIRKACMSILVAHASTRERLEILAEFYPRLFTLTGQPDVILDLACGLNPLTFPWMGLPMTVRYHAYDIHSPRIDLINHFFSLQGLTPLAQVQDILVTPPQVEADIAFIFKEIHRLDQRQPGCNRNLWQAIRARWLLVSVPPTNLTGQHHLANGYRLLVHKMIEGLSWQVVELSFKNELVFCIHKTP
jgi:16S rRNA (guanine(1405)-N(7))-methyltransferase